MLIAQRFETTGFLFSTQHSALSTQHSALSTQHFAIYSDKQFGYKSFYYKYTY
ncbi:hypothetical protein [Nostoc sp. DedQUE09]|uniref:hypothetical protein n=1 Tax=Nostoc sp. DedQUE09 TaxID=3075394 RepID=UPI002AD25CA4|nr:hypothetical protein [Nostoc sp. DedQUE09]MDZ7952512.1 hypothetical protein [Nostoc sp. DedQUE09]